MSSWQRVSDGRWTWTADEDRHLLLHSGDVLVELHDRTIHVYGAPAELDEQPLDGARWLRTAGLVAPPATDDAAWAAMAEHATG